MPHLPISPSPPATAQVQLGGTGTERLPLPGPDEAQRRGRGAQRGRRRGAVVDGSADAALEPLGALGKCDFFGWKNG